MRSVLFHAATAILGLGLAYWAYRADHAPEQSAEAVTVLECEPARVARVVLEAPQKTVTLERREVSGERLFWVRVERTSDAGEVSTVEFVGADAAEEYLDRVAPLGALRSLGAVGGESRAELGLAEPDTHLRVTCGDREHGFDVGGSAYGTGNRYLTAADGGPVFLVEAALVRDLESAEFRLMQRDLHAFEDTEVVALRVEGFGRQKRLVQRNRFDPGRAEWVDAEAPDRRNELFGNWLSRMGRLRAQSYLPVDAEPGSDLEGQSVAPETVMSLAYEGEGERELGRLSLVRVDGTERVYYAKSELTRGWVRVPPSAATQAEDDLRAVFGLDPLPRPARPSAEGDTPEGGAEGEPGPEATAEEEPGEVAAPTPTPVQP